MRAAVVMSVPVFRNVHVLHCDDPAVFNAILVPAASPCFHLLLQFPSTRICRRTLSILAPADLDELLDIGDFGRHRG
jgi:hypothetical protein